MNRTRIGVHCVALAVGAAFLGVVIGTMIGEPSTEATVVLFGVGIVLVVLSFLGRRARGADKPG